MKNTFKMREAVKKEKRIQIKKQYVILMIIFAISMVVLAYKLYEHYRQTESNSNIREELNTINEEIKTKSEEEKTLTKIEKLEELQKTNTDIVALIEIEGTNINYPVLQTDNNSYYMNHNYKKEESKDGSLFLDKDYNWELPSSNLLVYGHNNIGSSEMFVELMKYKDQAFYNDHKTIKFTTNQEESEFEIIAVFLSRVYYKSETDVFRYYYFINAENEQEFNSYVQNCKNSSLYNIEATAQYGDQLLTLSTCSYHTNNGRLAVVAKKINK